MKVSSLDVPDVGESHPHKNASDGFVQKVIVFPICHLRIIVTSLRGLYGTTLYKLSPYPR